MSELRSQAGEDWKSESDNDLLCAYVSHLNKGEGVKITAEEVAGRLAYNPSIKPSCFMSASNSNQAMPYSQDSGSVISALIPLIFLLISYFVYKKLLVIKSSYAFAGRFSAIFSGLVAISSVHRFLTKGIDEAIVGLLVLLTVAIPIAFLIGFFVHKIRNASSQI